MSQKMCFSDIYVLFGVRRKFFKIISTIFRKKREIP